MPAEQRIFFMEPIGVSRNLVRLCGIDRHQSGERRMPIGVTPGPLGRRAPRQQQQGKKPRLHFFLRFDNPRSVFLVAQRRLASPDSFDFGCEQNSDMLMPARLACAVRAPFLSFPIHPI